MIPFFVVDRPVSLEIIKGLFLMLPGKVLGLMTHAYTSRRFVFRFAEFPKGTPFRHMDIDVPEGADEDIGRRVVKFADSGIFSRDRRVSYASLFRRYEELRADYGAIIDFFHDPEATLESARRALRVYRRSRYKFKLVGVVQGNTLDEYLRGYEALLNMGYRYIAVGGMLKRSGNSNFLGLRRDGCCEVSRVITAIKKRFSPDWLFVFGVLSPKRLDFLEELEVWGADYKGWLYHYEEDYSFVLTYLKHHGKRYGVSDEDMRKLTHLLKIYSTYKRKHGFKTMYNFSDEEKRRSTVLKDLKREIDGHLKRYGLSLQYFRFKRVRENLVKIFGSRSNP